MTFPFNVGDSVETTQSFKEWRIKYSKQTGQYLPKYEFGTIIKIKTITFPGYFIKDMKIVTLDNNFTHNAAYFQKVV